MNTLAERVSYLRNKLNLSQEELARKAGISRVAISKAELGITKSFNGETLFNVARALYCNPEWLQTGKGSMELNAPTNINLEPVNLTSNIKDNQFPLLSWINAGEWAVAEEPYPAELASKWIQTTQKASENSFWLEVKGDSMTSPAGLSIPEGMLILVDPNVVATTGRLVIAKLIDSNEATFKRYIEDGGRRYLKPLNPEYRMQEINGNCQIIGVVIEAKWDNL